MREYTKKPESQSRTLDSNPKASRQAPIDVILQRYKERNIQQYVEDEELIQGKFSDIVQREEFDEDELLQGKFDTAQREEIDEDELLQGKFATSTTQREEIPSEDEEANLTGLPDNLKTGIENLSGYSMDDVRVHYNSDKPAQLQALAYTQGTDIHVAPGQEKHLPHEAWHVVQQKQGRVQPTMQLQGVNINDNEGLEREADVMGGKVIKTVSQICLLKAFQTKNNKSNNTSYFPMQFRLGFLKFGTFIATHSFHPQAATWAARLANNWSEASQIYEVAKAIPNQATLINILAWSNNDPGLILSIIQRVGGVWTPALTAITNQITAAHAAQLPNLITLAGGAMNLMLLNNLINHITPPNTFMLHGLIPLIGGAANLGALDALINNITVANVMLLFQLVPIAGGAAGVGQLNNLIIAFGPAQVNLLLGMIPNAGGIPAIPFITQAINHAHPGQGNLAEPLTRVVAGNLIRFQLLVNHLPDFTQLAPPGGIPANVANEVQNYNNRNNTIPIGNGGIAPIGNNLPFYMRIGQVNFNHFLERHTMRYFNFNRIMAVNDLWPFVGAATDNQVGNVLAATLQVVYNNPAQWWIQPNIAQQINAGGFQSTIGTTAGGPNMQNPITLLGNIPSVILGQFFPMPAGGGGVIGMNNQDMNAILQLL